MKVNIEYEWHEAESGNTQIPERHIGELEEDAMGHITYMIRNGFIGGYMNHLIIDSDNTETHYKGSWKTYRVNQ